MLPLAQRLTICAALQLPQLVHNVDRQTTPLVPQVTQLRITLYVVNVIYAVHCENSSGGFA